MHRSSPPLVSVVIAFLNEERFLAEAVESVLRQEYGHWELVLVDDGSTDGSTVIAKSYAAQRPHQISYCEHAGHLNKGLSASRNLGIHQSHGSFIALLDADDVWLPSKLTHQVAIFQQHSGLGMVAEASKYWYSWDEPTKADEIILVGALAGQVYQPTELLLHLYPFRAAAAPCPSGLMIARRAFEAAGGFEESFTKSYQLYEDQAFLSKIYLREQVYISASCHNLYRQRVGSIVQAVKAEGQYHHVRRYFLEWFERYLTTHALRTKHLDKLVARALRPYRRPIIHYLTSFLRNNLNPPPGW